MPIDAAESLRELVSTHILTQLNWYRTRAKIPMLLFQAAGLLIILLGIAIPILTQYSDESLGGKKDFIVSLIGLGITALTSLNTFFGWERTWRTRRLTESDLDRQIAIWKLEFVRADTMPADDRVDHLFAATKELFQAAYGATRSETEQFFEGLKTRTD